MERSDSSCSPFPGGGCGAGLIGRFCGEQHPSELVQSFEDTDLVDGQAEFHVTAAIQDDENTTCDYSGTVTVQDDALTVVFTAGEMTEASPEGGSTAYHVAALDEADRTVVLKAAQ